MTDKPGAALAQRDTARARVNDQLVKLEQQTRQPWSPDSERRVRIDAAILEAWSARETSAYLGEAAERAVETLDPVMRQMHQETLNLVDRIDVIDKAIREGADRLSRWTTVLSLLAAGLLIVAAFQLWLVWSLHR